MNYKELFKFCVVGGIGSIINLGLLYSLTEWFGVYYLLSSCIAIELSIISNFILNDQWTFRENKSKHIIKRALYYQLISLIGLSIQLTTVYILTDLINIYYILSGAIAIGVVVAWNYTVNKRITFRSD